MLYLVHGKGAFDGGHAFDAPQGVEQKLLIVLHVVGMDFQQVVEVARDVVAFSHLRHLHDALREVVGNVSVELAELHLAKHYEALVELVGIHHRDVALDEALALQSAPALEHGSGREVDLRGQFLVGQAGIVLECLQDEQVGAVEAFDYGHIGEGVLGLKKDFLPDGHRRGEKRAGVLLSDVKVEIFSVFCKFLGKCLPPE